MPDWGLMGRWNGAVLDRWAVHGEVADWGWGYLWTGACAAVRCSCWTLGVVADGLGRVLWWAGDGARVDCLSVRVLDCVMDCGGRTGGSAAEGLELMDRLQGQTWVQRIEVSENDVGSDKNYHVRPTKQRKESCLADVLTLSVNC